MSLKTWKDEFYPTKANSPEAKADPIYHSLRKWIGMRKEALDEHGLVVSRSGNLFEDIYDLFEVSSSCSLCEVYKVRAGGPPTCTQCPLTKTRGAPCDKRVSEDETEVTPWGSWTMFHDPEPMIELLKKAKKGN